MTMTKTKTTDWIQTYTGRRFSVLEPDPAAVDIVDIAHSLSLLCRFNGHCATFYSVAEHSTRVSLLVPAEDAGWGLLHDAAEAYVSDLPRPIKRQLPTFDGLEEGVLRAIGDAFGLAWPPPASVWRADDRLLVTEARDLMGPPPEPWKLQVAPLAERIEPVGPAEARAAFLTRFESVF